ncbi:hypothetical protein H112_03269 [Trichophyton rubrum D6]|uniref:Uncharacterized protein n=4 Tax=Trichophyton TaxID=5550 RepID=A0A178EVT7_TRIRU|nr:uncharacterized protein TERG_05874 [Trichophyton rubrum CBS 118892]EZF24193.1 hypothetical protein H100_03273 [Trichophyton rubrum MR850]EZF43234.1 hypothetical protein H102_03267 [Trichophyton rubrum CBS 100081]EZF53891.1 hypothetical protein H103_03281 [Trichophyton rubrum CBS 288.86]EZF64494.1 hypothetical protein H104_03264 [Trichophyton rubrum CBS 289.86]EZF75122.1 hypothetical protein H105_03284 [Trichophyton soudanense CBS 452.61]EZF85783.1 hypothetical protein H110_03273 [Trichophy
MEDIRFLVNIRARVCCSDDSQSPYIIVINIPPTILQELDTIYPDKGPKITANLQDKILIIEAIITKAHEIAARRLKVYIDQDIMKMGLEFEVLNSGEARTTSGTFVKEPDTRFTLLDHDWPILVIEAGVFESDTKLKMDARGWLEPHDRKQKLL